MSRSKIETSTLSLPVEYPVGGKMLVENINYRSKRQAFIAQNFINDGMVWLAQESIRRLGVAGIGRLAKFYDHRLIAHERLVFGQELGNVLRYPAADAVIAADNSAVAVDTQAIIDVTFQILQYSAEPDHRFLRFFSAIPSFLHGFRRRHRRKRRATADLAPRLGKIAPPFVFPGVIERPAELLQVQHKLALYLGAIDGIGDLLDIVLYGNSDIEGDASREQKRIKEVVFRVLIHIITKSVHLHITIPVIDFLQIIPRIVHIDRIDRYNAPRTPATTRRSMRTLPAITFRGLLALPIGAVSILSGSHGK